MKSLNELPSGYEKAFEIDLQKNKRLAFAVNAAALVIAAVMIIPACFIVPISDLFNIEKYGFAVYLVRFAVMLAGMVVYMILHELVHGFFMKRYSKLKPTYGFTGLYAYAGSEAYFYKKPYIIIALAPVVIWGVCLAVISFLVSEKWFWVVYFIQICNISGATGDFYVVAKFFNKPDNMLVKDIGVSMTAYLQKN